MNRKDYKFYEQLAKEWFEERGNIVHNLNDEDQHSQADLEVMNKDGYCINVEIKRRKCASYDYPDTLLEAHKFNYLYENNGWYLAIFDDGC